MIKPIVCAIAALVLLAAPALAADLPTPHVTPGETRSVTLADLCTPGRASAYRKAHPVTDALKSQVLKSYGQRKPKPGEVEYDHLISIELGGITSAKNIWAQSYVTKPWNAHLKDAVEDRLHALVCSGTISLADAQREISADWIKAYRKYLGTP